MKFAAVIVLYRPNLKDVIRLIESLIIQVDSIFVMNNGSSDDVVTYLEKENVQIFDMGGNVGIASALNFAAKKASYQKIDFLVTFDQDSVAVSNHIEGLYKAWTEKNSRGFKVAGVGPSFYDERSGEKFQYPFYKGNGAFVEKIFYKNDMVVDVDILITSGMLVKVDVVLENPFLDSLFIDFVDTEWCFRVNELGYKNYGSFAVCMQHELSESAPKKMAGLTLLKYSPLRRYYFFRNCFYVLRKKYVPYSFKLRMGISMIIRLLTLWKVDQNSTESLKMSLKGLSDSMKNKMGKLDG